MGFLIAALLAAIPSAAASDTERLGTPAPDSAAADVPIPLAVGVIEDGGFEAGTPNPFWAEASDAVGTPLCTVAACGLGGGTGPRSGDWWVWFGGVLGEEAGAVYQEVVIPSGTASLSFYLEIPVALVASLFQATVDGEVVFEADSLDQATYSTYAEVTVDISAYADGKPHGLGFAGAKLAGGPANFFLDDVSLETSASRLPPVAVNDNASVANGGTVKIDVLANDANPEGEALEIIKTSGPSHGTASWSVAEGKFIYTHDGSYTTSDSFTYKLADTVLESAPATVSIAIAAKPSTAPTVGLQDPATGQWHLRDAAGAVTTFFFGNPGDVAFMGDWDCDGVATPGLFRQSDAYAYLRNSNTQGVADIRFFFGNPSDVPLAGDFNGNGCDTLSIYRPSEQTFYIMNQLGKNEGGLGAAEYTFGFGNPGDKPVVGDWDGDGIDEVGLHRESTGFFYFRDTLTTGTADGEFYFGDPGDRFVAGDWGVVDHRATPAVFRPGNTTFYFRHTMTAGNADSSFVWGRSGFMPVAGNFGALPGGGGIEPSPPPAPAPPPPGAPPVDGTFAGPLQAQPGLSGDVTFGVSAAGTQVSDPIVHLVFDNYQMCGATISADGIQKLFTTVPVVGSSFTVTGAGMSWQGTFDSATSASGTVSGEYELELGGTNCPWGPVPWTATAN